jgi:hypothetical protein
MNCCPSLSSECLVIALRISRESENKGESRLRKLGRFFFFFWKLPFKSQFSQIWLIITKNKKKIN